MQDVRLVVNGLPVVYTPTEAPDMRRAMGDEAGQKEFFREDLPGCPHLVALEPTGGPRRTFGPVTVPEGHYLMLGDNRELPGHLCNRLSALLGILPAVFVILSPGIRGYESWGWLEPGKRESE